MTEPPRQNRNIPMTVLGWILLSVVVSLTVMVIEALFFTLSVH
ncbi:MAG TPA: hypothetical protein PKV72_05440 [Candidatus Peribacteria bacterium]|nr:hypothetical protein [Candidatus Peribacteria bacterium]